MNLARQPERPRDPRCGFTLVELLLVVAVILLLAGAVILNFDALGKGSRLDEGATQLEALFRFARAEAASTGRPVRVVLAGTGTAEATATATATADAASIAASPATNAAAPADSAAAATPAPADGVSLHWEPDPLGAPGRFEPVLSAAPLVGQINELVRVLPSDAATNGVALPASEAFGGAFAAADAAPAPMAETAAGPAPVMFYPDGSSDNAELVLVARDDDDPRRMIVRLSGMTGSIQRHVIAPGDEPAAASEPVRPEPADPVTGPPGK